MGTIDEVMTERFVHALKDWQVEDVDWQVVGGHEVVGKPVQGQLPDFLLGFVALVRLNEFLGSVSVVMWEQYFV